MLAAVPSGVAQRRGRLRHRLAASTALRRERKDDDPPTLTENDPPHNGLRTSALAGAICNSKFPAPPLASEVLRPMVPSDPGLSTLRISIVPWDLSLRSTVHHSE